MSEYGISATQMSAPSARASVQAPIQDTSTQYLVGTIAEQIPEMRKGREFAKLSDDIFGAAEEYKTRLEAPNALAEASAQEMAVEELWAATSEEDLRKLSGEDFWKGVDEMSKVERGIDETLNKYKKAYEQGVMSADELTARVNKATRVAINRSPGLAQELLQRAKFYQDMAGITSIEDESEKKAKAQAEMAKKRIDDEDKMLIEWGINPNTLTPSGRATHVQWAFGQEQKSKMMSQALKNADTLEREGKLNQLQVDALVKDPAASAAWNALFNQNGLTVLNNLKSGAFTKQYKEMTTNPVDANLAGIQSTFAQLRNQTVHLSVLASPQVKPIYDQRIKELDAQEKLMTDIAMGGPKAEAAQRELSAKQAAAKLPFVTLEQQADIASKMAATMANLQVATLQRQDPNTLLPVMTAIQESIQNYYGGVGRPPVEGLDLKTKDGQAGATYLFSTINPEDHPTLTPEEAVKTNSRTVGDTIKQFKELQDPAKFNQALDKWMEVVTQESKRMGKAVSTRISPEVRQQVMEFFADTANNARMSGTISYNPATDSFTVVKEDGSRSVNAEKRVNQLFKGMVSFAGYEDQTRIDEAGRVWDALANLRPAAESLKEGSKGAVKPSKLSEQEVNDIMQYFGKGTPLITAPIKEETTTERWW